MKAFSLPIAIVLVLLSSQAGQASEFMQGLGDVRYHHLESARVGRPYQIYVRIPAGYDQSDASYPTLYLLDGGNLFPMLAPYYQYLHFGGEIPELIVVGISYGNDNFEGGNFRSTDYTAPSEERDYWGGAARFQAFLETELLPHIDATYRTDRSRRTIMGQSLGGQFVLYTAQTRPELFWGHIASNPALHRNLDFFLTTRPASASQSKLFVASATGDSPQFREPALRWIEHWSRDDALPWQLHVVHLEGHSHMSAPPASFRQGLRWLFDGE